MSYTVTIAAETYERWKKANPLIGPILSAEFIQPHCCGCSTLGQPACPLHFDVGESDEA